jgi:hypothetical protein
MITALGRLLLDDEPNHPQALLERSRRPGRSMGTLAHALEGFFTGHGLALATDQSERLAPGRRQRRIDAVPKDLRPAVEAFAAFMMRSRDRALRAGTRPRTDNTVEAALAIVRDLAQFLHGHRGKQDWALADIHDMEAFLAHQPKARKRRLVARTVLPLRPCPEDRAHRPRPRPDRPQPERIHRSNTDARPATRGVPPLDHWPGSSSARGLAGHARPAARSLGREVKLLRIDDLDDRACTVRLGDRPHPVPLDPASWAVLKRCLAHREAQRTDNPHVMVTRQTKSGRGPASTAYVSHVLDGCGFPPRKIRCTRLLDLVNTMDPKLVAAAFGMDPEATMIYLADHVDAGRLPEPCAPNSQ